MTELLYKLSLFLALVVSVCANNCTDNETGLSTNGASSSLEQKEQIPEHAATSLENRVEISVNGNQNLLIKALIDEVKDSIKYEISALRTRVNNLELARGSERDNRVIDKNEEIQRTREATTSGHCRDGWIRYRNSCYLFSREVATWPEAYATCQALHSYLATIPSAIEHNFLKSELNHLHPGQGPTSPNLFYWVDGVDIEVEDVWKWSRTGQNITYQTGWGPGEPNHDGNCLHLWNTRNFALADFNCQRPWRYICEQSVGDGE